MMTITKKTPVMDSKQPRMLRKEIKRIRISRDNLKDKSRDKSKELNNTRDALRDAKLSRNRWKAEAKELGKEFKLVEESIR